MYRRVMVLLAICTASLLAACSSAGGTNVGNDLPIPDSTTSITSADLRIGPMDSLQIDVFGVEDLNGTFQVDFEGKLKLPLIGEMPVVGMTAGELAYSLEQRYGENYLQDPDVNVTVLESVGRRITVDGSVNSPGLYDVTGNMSLLQAVALAGGPSPGANPGKVVVFRQVDGERHAAAFNLSAIRRGAEDDPQIYGNDVIIIDGSEARAVYGELLDSVRLIALFLAF